MHLVTLPTERKTGRCLLRQNGRLWRSKILQCMHAYQPETLIEAMKASQTRIIVGDFTDPGVIERWGERSDMVTKALKQFYQFGACCSAAMGRNRSIVPDKELSPAANSALILYLVIEYDHLFMTNVPFMGMIYGAGIPHLLGELLAKPDHLDQTSPLLKYAMTAMLKDERSVVRWVANKLLIDGLWHRDWVRELYKEMLVSDRHKEHLPKTIRCLARLERLPPDETRSFLKGISLKRLREILAREDITEYRKGTVRDWIKTREDAEQGAPADAKRPRR